MANVQIDGDTLEFVICVFCYYSYFLGDEDE